MPADKTFAQVYPGISNFQAILAAISTRDNFPDLVEVRTIRCHQFFSFFSLIDALQGGLALQQTSESLPGGNLRCYLHKLVDSSSYHILRILN